MFSQNLVEKTRESNVSWQIVEVVRWVSTFKLWLMILFLRLESVIKVLFSSPHNQKIFQDFPSHRHLRHMYGALNIDKKS